MAISRDARFLMNLFENLAITSFEITSKKSRVYNCIAWAATGEENSWWEPAEDCEWPQGVPPEYSIDAYLGAFRSVGYSECSNAELETGFEKIALYASRGRPTHAARQLADGWWTSKIGRYEDIRHASLEALSGEMWGQVVCVMSRSSSMASPSSPIGK